MGKFYGEIGYAETEETSPGIWTEYIKARPYYGDTVRYSKRTEEGSKINNDISVTNEISILADPYAMAHFATMRYVEWMGVKWKVRSVEVQYPRLNISIGGVYNGDET